MSDMKTLKNIFKDIQNIQTGTPSDWDKNITTYRMVLEADYDGIAFLGLSDEEQTKVINKVQNIVKGDETLWIYSTDGLNGKFIKRMFLW